MKRWLVIISLLLLLLTFNSIAFGANGIINVSMNGSKVQVKEVPILMNGQAFVSEVPSFVMVDRTLVPIRFVAEGLGAEVKWDQKTKTATLLHENKVVKLTIDSNKVLLNSDTKTLDKNSIPKLVTFANNDSRTMVPVRFISEVFGYEVGWDENNQVPYINTDEVVVELNPDVSTPSNPTTPPTAPSGLATITNVEVVKGSTSKHRVVIKSDQIINYKTLFLPDSNKLVIDIENSKLNASGTGDINVVDNNISKVTYSQYGVNPYSTRIVVELRDKVSYEFFTSPDGKVTTLTFEDYEFNKISSEYINGREALVIDNLKNVEYKVLKLKSPERIVIDLLDTNLTEKIYNYDFKVGFIKGVRVSQFIADSNYSSNDRIVRIVLDISDGVNNPNIEIERDKDRLIIYPERSFWENITYDSSATDKMITIKNLESSRYDVEYYPDLKKMDITIPSENSSLIQSAVSIKDNFVEDIKITKDNDDTTVSITFKRGIVYDVLSGNRSEEIKVAVRRDPSIVYNDKTIVLDPGHGGKDPGAISPNGVKEKDVNLAIGLKSKALLESLGYDVIMTRTDDTYVNLYDRANVANNNKADIFVSIHHNSTLNNTVNGLEILYCPRDQGTAKEVDQYPLAEAISKGILASTGGKDRGIIQRPGLVVIRETNMASVLVEVGYLSNASDEASIVSEAYQNKVVAGMIKGIQNYFEMN